MTDRVVIPTRRAPTAWIAGIASAAIGALAIGGWVALRPATKVEPLAVAAAASTEVQAPSASPVTPQNPPESEASVLDQATLLMKNGDLAGAHRRLGSVPLDSPLRTQTAFVDVENAWADAELARAERESDATEKRKMLDEVIASAADESRRKRARKLLAAAPAAKGAKTPAPSKPGAPAQPSATPPASPTPPSTLPPRF
jgi:hypothetical protein